MNSQSNQIEPVYLLASVALGALTAYSLRSRHKKPVVVMAQEQVQVKQEPAPFVNIAHLPQQKINKLQIKDNKDNELIKELKNLEDITCEIERVSNLVYDLKIPQLPIILNPMHGNSSYRTVYGGEGFMPETAFVNHDCFILQTPSFGPNDLLSRTKRWLRAGPRKHLFFQPQVVNAGIVVCGGLCPGINVIIRELTMCLHYNYKVNSIQGARYGFNGIYNNQWIELQPKAVKQIHHLGGCILGTARSVFDAEKIIDELTKKEINQLYLVGGAGSLKSAQILFELVKERNLPIVILVIPKSIENDIPIVDRSFGFQTAIEEAQTSLNSGYSESHSRKNSVAIIRFIGRNTGFLAMNACLAFRSANICLVPEFQIDLYGERGLLAYVYKRLQVKGTCVIVVSEGAVNSIRDMEIKEKGRDASGNVKFGDVGLHLKEEIYKYNTSKGMSCEVKYIDPQYTVRSGSANSLDSKLCSQLAQNSIHAAMAGFTGFACGHVSNKTCLIPLSEMNSGNYANRITTTTIGWQRLLASTGQPAFLNDYNDILA